MDMPKTKKDSPFYLEKLAQFHATQIGHHLLDVASLQTVKLTEEQEKQIITDIIVRLQHTGDLPKTISTDRLNIFVMKLDDCLRSTGFVGI